MYGVFNLCNSLFFFNIKIILVKYKITTIKNFIFTNNYFVDFLCMLLYFALYIKNLSRFSLAVNLIFDFVLNSQKPVNS